MNTHDENRMRELLQEALPPVHQPEPGRDLWPQMLRRLDRRTPTPWFDWALAAALLALMAFFPACIPVMLYYL